MKCTKCGVENPQGNKFCSECGNVMEVNEIEGTEENKNISSNKNTNNNKAPIGKILLWIFFLPIMLIITIIKYPKFNKITKIGLVSLVIIFTGFALVNGSEEDTVVGDTSNVETESKVDDEKILYEKLINSELKGKNFSVEINEKDGQREVSINLDPLDNRFSNVIVCGIEGLKQMETIRTGNPTIYEKTDIFKLNFFADGIKMFSSSLDNSANTKFNEIKLTNISNNEEKTITEADIAAYQNQLEEAQKQAAAKAEAELIASYNTGITFEQLARTPDAYKFKKVTFTGKVIQVMEGSGHTQLRIAINDDYDKVVLVDYSSDIIKTRVLDNDYVTIKGISGGLYTYKSVMGGEITIPIISVDIISIN
jgi:hypothetical protein